MTIRGSTVSPKSLLENAIGLADAVEVLVAKRQNSTVYAIGILAAHALEVSLKGYLLYRGVSEGELKKNIRHDLMKAWSAAKEVGLSIDPNIPHWVQVLNFSHNDPYYFRYPPEEFGVGIPNVDELVQNIKSVITTVQDVIQK